MNEIDRINRENVAVKKQVAVKQKFIKVFWKIKMCMQVGYFSRIGVFFLLLLSFHLFSYVDPVFDWIYIYWSVSALVFV